MLWAPLLAIGVGAMLYEWWLLTQNKWRMSAVEWVFLTGTLLCAEGTYADNTQHLRSSYDLTWRPYSELPGPGGPSSTSPSR
ncbi:MULTISPECIES: hypothetical protein [unclassified Streptomyces]|uniref:hypothetical protein n=1 Tax=unclassified Streptomyces TaxID=2593676 RepID=UPI003321B131